MISTNTRIESSEAMVPNVLNIAVKTSTNILPDRIADGSVVSYREIQNLSGTDLYYAVGCDCNANTQQFLYHGKLIDGEKKQFFTKQRVSVYSIAGGRVATLELVVRNPNS